MKPRRVTRIGRVALGVSILAIALLVTTGWLFYTGTLDAPGIGPIAGHLFEWSLLATVIATLGAIALDIVAIAHGSRNRVVGIVGLAILPAPAILFVAYLLVANLLSHS